MAITDWPEAERPREKLLKKGSEGLSDAELLAVFLRTGCAGKSAVDLARDLLTHFDGLRGVLEASMLDFCDAQGLGPAKYAALQAVLEMARRHISEQLQRNDVFSSPALVKQYVQRSLRHQPREVFAVLLLDNQHRLLSYRELFYGTIDGASVYPREVVKLVLAENAAAVIFTHNHPSGVAEPSQADTRITHCLKEALGLLDVRVLDHLVVGDNEVVSFAERGLL